MGLCVSIPIQQSLNDEIREIENLSRNNNNFIEKNNKFANKNNTTNNN
jgi:hypothetical protein